MFAHPVDDIFVHELVSVLAPEKVEVGELWVGDGTVQQFTHTSQLLGQLNIVLQYLRI